MLKHLNARHQVAAMLGADIASVIRPYIIASAIKSLCKRILTTLDRSVMPCNRDTTYLHPCRHSIRAKMCTDVDPYVFHTLYRSITGQILTSRDKFQSIHNGNTVVVNFYQFHTIRIAYRDGMFIVND